MMELLIPLAGLIILVLGFGMHFIGQLISLIDWDSAVKLGIAEKGLLSEYKDYEKGIALADVYIGWIYLPIGLGILLGQNFSFKLAWIPGVVFIYHSLCFFFWTRYQNQAGNVYRSESMRIGWFIFNFIGGLIVLLVAFFSKT